MSNFPNAVYIPTGVAGGEEFIRISGYCYKRVAAGVAEAGEVITNFVTGFDDCLDCNTCNCPKNIQFIMGGISHNITTDEYTFQEKSFNIKTSSTGWQEIAIQSGFLNDGNSDIEFKPLSIRCYDRKIDLQSGIFASFDSPTSHIAHFQYSSGQDLYERRDLANALSTGEFGAVPAWDYITQYDNAVSYQNTLRTIKFKSLCETTCSHYDINFRMRGLVEEDITKYLETAGSAKSWVYLNCTGIPRTAGQIVKYNFPGSGLVFNQYYNVPETAGEPRITFQPEELELVNMDLLTGNTNDLQAQHFSVTGGRHYYAFKGVAQGYPFTYGAGYPFDFYDFDSDGDVDYHGSGELIASGITALGLGYSKLPGCNNQHVKNFKKSKGYGASDTPSSGCFETSEYLDGRFKIGTYKPMMFTGLISGGDQEYRQVYDLANPDNVTSWSSGVYVFQTFPSGNDSLLSNISGYAGNIAELSNSNLITEYRKQISNSTPINIDNPIRAWQGQSGSFVLAGASLTSGALFLEFDGPSTYNVLYQLANRSTVDGSETIFAPYASGFRFNSGSFAGFYKTQDSDTYFIGSDVASPPLLDMTNHTPISHQSTLVKPNRFIERHLILDSGNSLQQAGGPANLSDSLSEDPISSFTNALKSITFQIPFDE